MTAKIATIEETHVTRCFTVQMKVTIGEVSQDIECHVALELDLNTWEHWMTLNEVKPESLKSLVEEHLEEFIHEAVKHKAFDAPDE